MFGVLVEEAVVEPLFLGKVSIILPPVYFYNGDYIDWYAAYSQNAVIKNCDVIGDVYTNVPYNTQIEAESKVIGDPPNTGGTKKQADSSDKAEDLKQESDINKSNIVSGSESSEENNTGSKDLATFCTIWWTYFPAYISCVPLVHNISKRYRIILS